MMLQQLKLVMAIILLGFSSLCFASNIMVLNLSSDAHYAISTDDDGHVYLWDLQKQTDQKIADDANPFSAYWVKGTNYFMWQNQDNNIVTVQDPTGKIIKTFNPKIQSYGSILSENLNVYIAADHDWSPYYMDTNTGEITHQKSGFSDLKPFTFEVSDNEKYLLGVGNAAELFLTNIQTGTQIFLDPNDPQGKTFATFSPDGKYIVSGNEGTWGYVWSVKTSKKLLELWGLWSGISTQKDQFGNSINFDKTGLISPPSDFADNDGVQREYILSMKFIDETHYLRFTTRIPYAILYNVTDPKPLKYFPLGRHPFPAVNYYERDQAIDTSPSDHILVIAKESGEGILVYKYDPQKQILSKAQEINECTVFC